MYSLSPSQGVFLPSFHQVSNGFFRGSRNTVKAKSGPATGSNFRQAASTTATTTDLPITTLLDDPLVCEVAKELSKIPKNELAALLDRTILPRIQVFCWGEKKIGPKSHWKESFASAPTYFENVNGFEQHQQRKVHSSREATLSLNPSLLTTSGRVDRSDVANLTFERPLKFSFLSGGRQLHPSLNFARGFKTKRSDSGTLPFTRRQTQESEPWRGNDLGHQEDLSGSHANHLKNLSNHLSLEERDKLTAAIHGYLLGKKEGSGDSGLSKNKIEFFTDPSSKSLGKIDVGSGSQGNYGKRINIWDKVNKVASVLIIIAIVVSLTQIFNIPFLRMGRGNNEIAPEDIDVTFDDVKGCDEAKQELQEIVEFLMHPEKFSALGGKLPKGCLLVGSPGTGKTLLARAVAGQAGVPFFHASGSEFDEVLVGQGARRVRDLFRAAKTRAPCVIFIDEIDSVGSKRTSSVLHPYANQTINQLLAEMDGFLPNEGVVVLGATNRAEDLDKALLRPGRFDTQVVVPTPDMKGRKEILILYLSKIKHDNSVDVDKLAKMTVGFSGADLENMVNTAAIRAAVDGKEWVTMSEFEYSHDKHVLGTDWKSRVRDKEDLKITAYHEAGHTLVAYFTEGSKPLHKVTIVAKGMSGGHTAFLPEKDAYHETRMQFIAQMDVAMGGRAAEELIFSKEKVTGGASHDLEGATAIAEIMVKKLGMSEKIGLRVIPDSHGFAGRSQELGPATTELIDSEVSRLLNESYKRAIGVLKSHRRELDLLAEALLNYETLDADDIHSIIDGDPKTVDAKMASSNRVLVLSRTRGTQPAAGTPPQPKVTGKPDILGVQ